MRGFLYHLLLDLAGAVKPVNEWDGKHYLICTRCGNSEYIHDGSCDQCNYIKRQGICWDCFFQDVMDGEKE